MVVFYQQIKPGNCTVLTVMSDNYLYLHLPFLYFLLGYLFISIGANDTYLDRPHINQELHVPARVRVEGLLLRSVGAVLGG